MEEYPSIVKDTLRVLSARKYHLDRGEVRGRPLFESLDEVAIVYYAIKNSDISKVARIIGYEVPALWRVVKKIEEEFKVSYWDTKESKIVTITINPKELLDRVEDMIKPKGKRIVQSVIDSNVIQEFIKNPVKKTKTGKVRHYTKSEVRSTIRHISDVASRVDKDKDIFEKYGLEVTNNPDIWASNRDYEKVIYEIIDRIAHEKYSDPIGVKSCKAKYFMMFRRIQAFSNWFEGEIGASKRRSKPIPHTIWYSDYLKLKEYLLNSNDKEYRALWGIIALHINTGAREGYESVEHELERLEVRGIKVDKSINDIDLDEDIVTTSLVGLKWDKVTVKDGKITSIEIYESKTEKVWLCLGIWLDRDLEQYLLKVREFALSKGIRSVVKSILMYEGVRFRNGKYSVGAFERWYSSRVKEVTKTVLGIKFTPHRLRSSHVSILAEFGVPLELSCSDSGFGVGWEDLGTAVHYYLRFSRHKVEEYFNRILQQIK
jgi:integrase